MDLLGRYIFRQAASALVMILITLTTIVWAGIALKYMSIMTSQAQGAAIFFKVTMLNMPNLIAIVAPVALFVASIHTLNRLSGDSELIIISASGGTIWRVIRPYFLLALIVSVFVFATNAWLQPMSARLLRSYLLQIGSDVISQVLQPGAFLTQQKGVTLHIRARDPDSNEMLGLIVHDERDPAQILTYTAERAQILKEQGDLATRDDDQTFLIMKEGQVHRLDGKSGEVQILTFDSYLFDVSQMAPKQGPYQYKTSERYLTELLYPDPNDLFARTITGKMRADLHDRLATPLYPILFILIAVIYVGQAQTTREARGDYIVAAFVVGTLCRAGGAAAQSLLVKQPWAISLVYGIPVTGILALALMARFNLKPAVVRWGSLSLPKLRFRRRAAA